MACLAVRISLVDRELDTTLREFPVTSNAQLARAF